MIGTINFGKALIQKNHGKTPSVHVKPVLNVKSKLVNLNGAAWEKDVVGKISAAMLITLAIYLDLSWYLCCF